MALSVGKDNFSDNNECAANERMSNFALDKTVSIMKKFIVKNNFWIMMGLAVCVALYAIFCWPSMTAGQQVISLFFIAVGLHCVEEMKLPGGFVEMVVTFVKLPFMDMGVPKLLLSCFIIYLGLIPLFLPSITWLAAAPLYLGIIEVIAHLLAAARMNTRKYFYSPGMATALLVFLPLTVWGFHKVITENVVSGWGWLWAFLYLAIPLVALQRYIVGRSGMKYTAFVVNALHTLFGKRGE